MQLSKISDGHGQRTKQQTWQKKIEITLKSSSHCQLKTNGVI